MSCWPTNGPAAKSFDQARVRHFGAVVEIGRKITTMRTRKLIKIQFGGFRLT
jgi:hypothetical protein